MLFERRSNAQGIQEAMPKVFMCSGVQRSAMQRSGSLYSQAPCLQFRAWQPSAKKMNAARAFDGNAKATRHVAMGDWFGEERERCASLEQTRATPAQRASPRRQQSLTCWEPIESWSELAIAALIGC